MHKTSLQSYTNPSLLPIPSPLPYAHLTQQQHNPNFSHNRSGSRGNWRSNDSKYSGQHMSDFMVFIPLLPWTGSRVIGGKPDSLLVLGNGLLTGHLSRTSSVSSASTSATQPHNVFSFTAAVTSPLPILLLVLPLLILGSRTLVQTNTLRLILRL